MAVFAVRLHPDPTSALIIGSIYYSAMYSGTIMPSSSTSASIQIDTLESHSSPSAARRRNLIHSGVDIIPRRDGEHVLLVCTRLSLRTGTLTSIRRNNVGPLLIGLSMISLSCNSDQGLDGAGFVLASASSFNIVATSRFTLDADRC